MLDAEGLTLEDIIIDEQFLIDNAKDVYERMSLFDPCHDKSETSLWHDAYCFAYIQKMQNADAQNAIDTHCLFLTADQALINFQRADRLAREHPPVAITPSQLLQMFSFSKADSGYEDTFIKFFASSSLGVSFRYSNDDVQEIMSRIEHYQDTPPEIAEKILTRELIGSRYFRASTDGEKEEIIYNSISEELLSELNAAKGRIASLEDKTSSLGKDREATLDLLAKNNEQYEAEKAKLRNDIAEARRKQDEESAKRQSMENSNSETLKFSAAQEDLYINEKMTAWKKKYLCWFWAGVITSVLIIGGSIFLWLYTGDSGCLGCLSLLALPIIPISICWKVYSENQKTKVRCDFIDTYHEKLRQNKK